MEAINIENQKEYIETVKKLNEDKNVKYSILKIGRAHVWTPVTWPSRMPSSAWKKKKKQNKKKKK